MLKPTIFVLFMYIRHGLTFSYDNCPNRTITTVDVQLSKWGIPLYINLVPKGYNLSCMYVTRQVENDGNGYFLGETTYYKENGVAKNNSLSAVRVGEGRYTFSKIVSSTTITVNAYFMIAQHPMLDMHYVCSNNSMFASINVSAVFVESRYPDPPKHFAKEIKASLDANGFNYLDLEVVNNCYCDNIPCVERECCCSKTETIEEFFSDC